MLHNKNGFTLIELLAVIVIIGILMTIGTTAVTKYISNSKKDAYAFTMKSYINAARESITSGEYKVQMWNYPATIDEIKQLKCSLPPTHQFTIIPINKINVENKTSPYKKNINTGYVVITNKNQDTNTNHDRANLYKYYFVGIDTQGNGVTKLIPEEDLNKKVIRTKIKSSEYSTTSNTDLGRLLKNYNNITSNNNIVAKTTIDTTNTFFEGYQLYQICM